MTPRSRNTHQLELKYGFVRELFENIVLNKSNYYLCMGGVSHDESNDLPSFDEDLTHSHKNLITFQDDLVFFKKILFGSISLVTKNFVWVDDGHVYDQWDHTMEMRGKRFYCINNESNVYKCISNNNGSVSTDQPQGQDLGVIRTTDGYLWKFLFHVNAVNHEKFLTDDYLPVPTTTTNLFSSKGGIEDIRILNGGSGYKTATSTTIEEIPKYNYSISKVNYDFLEVSRIDTPDPEADAQFGRACSLSEDGNVLAIGANLLDFTIVSNVGKVFIYDKSGNDWVLRNTITPPYSDPESDMRFGTSIDLSDDGSILVVGAHQRSTNVTDSGKVYVYDWNGSVWTLRGTVIPPIRRIDDHFGISCSLSSDGSILAVGTQKGDTGAVNAGEVYVYDWNGSAWILRGVIIPSDIMLNDQFGSSCSLNAAGNRIAIGTTAGKFYVFDWNGSVWSEIVKITGPESGSTNMFGNAIDLSADGKTLIVGDEGIELNQGKVYVYDYLTNDDESEWVLRTSFQSADIQTNNYFGSGLSFSNNGNYLVVSSFEKSVGDTPDDEGRIYCYDATVTLLDSSPLIYDQTLVKTSTGSGAVLRVSGVDPYGRIISLSVENAGSEYLDNSADASISVGSVHLQSSDGYGAVIKPLSNSLGGIIGATIENPGYGYSVGDTLQVISGAATFSVNVSKTNGSILGVTINDPGGGYLESPALSIVEVSTSPRNGVGIYGPSASVIAVAHKGSIQKVLVEDPGKDYSSETSTTLILQGDGSGAVLSPIVGKNGSIENVIIENPGKNYTFASVMITGTPETLAEVQPVIGSEILNNFDVQNVVEQTVVEGAIYDVVINNPGNGYHQNGTTAIIDGDGTGARATVTVNASGGISRVSLTSFGSGYTWAEVRLIDSQRNPLLGHTDAEMYCLLSPKGGHGRDAAKELFADKLMIYTTLSDKTTNFFLGQKYSTVGIVKNPLELHSRLRATVDDYQTIFSMKVSSVLDVSLNELVLGEDLVDENHVAYRLIAMDKNEKTLVLLQKSHIYRYPGNILEKRSQTDDSSPSVFYTVHERNDQPSHDKYSGDLLYLSFTRPFFIDDQLNSTKRTLSYRSVIDFDTTCIA